MDCLFCKIAAGEIPSAKVYEDERVLVFRDIAPAAPVHLLAIPKQHIGSAADINGQNSELVGYIFTVIARVAKAEGLENGFRIVSNVGADGGQTVPHLHFHILGGRELTWPAG
ncbi:MAG: histidine triad nucleotide-binding protein [Clostridiales bacterium]|nr:histidine triad nucleotide-binding protein [Clostridiales bacterium]